jgi:hypothetical protein
MRFGVCWQPRVWHGWLPPIPTLASWQAVRSIGITDLRLTYDPTLPASLFDTDLRNAHAARLRINVNMGAKWEDGDALLTPDPAVVEGQAFDLATTYGEMIALYSFDNEPGAIAQKYETVNPGSDFMRDAFMPVCAAFARGIRRVVPDAVIGGCDADSVDIQNRYIAQANALLPFVVCDRRRIHPYGDVGGARYATMAGDDENDGFTKAVDPRPLDVGEIDHQQLAGATGIARDSDLQALLDFTRMIHAKYRTVGQIDYGTAEYFFTRLPTPPGIVPASTWSTWTFGPAPVVSDAGRQFRQLFNAINSRRPPSSPALVAQADDGGDVA